MSLVTRGRVVAAGVAVASAIGGVATNRVQGAWWIQALWFAAAVVAAGTAAWLVRIGEGSMRDGKSGASATQVKVADTGKAMSGTGGEANTGLTGPADALPGDGPAEIVVERTGDAEGGAGANTGIRLT
ncbi:hypothetical protein [Actinomadura rupiterrae]|uniref:hypothetical protein n=1 Tax=Actinomadura rupiterrae TaxID=559627 RepID=UPI0020A32E07|nr:hypothetical protein [Actinomadura rupiterrae]MCP2341776.1 hypothetical protein [Actinomadura rupiterrae]